MKDKDKDNAKQYEEYSKSHPQELDLFSLNHIFLPKRDEYSSISGLYDIMPKYYHGDLATVRTKEGYLPILKREFKFKNQTLCLKVTPALLLQPDGSTKAFYPTKREELVEDVLRKLAIDPLRHEFLDDGLAVKFTLYDVWKELKNTKHFLHYAEIYEALNVLSKTLLEITNQQGTTSFTTPMFDGFGTIQHTQMNVNSWADDNEATTIARMQKIQYFIRFSSFVSNSIKEKTWRLINYQQCIAYKRNISRWLHKRLAYLFIQAKLQSPFNILASTIARDSGMSEYSRFKDQQKQIELCLQEMIQIGSLERYEVEKIFQGKKLVDAKFLLYISNTFFQDTQMGYIAISDQQYNKNAAINTSQQQLTLEVESTQTSKPDVQLLEANIATIKNILANIFPQATINKLIAKKSLQELSSMIESLNTAVAYIQTQQAKNKTCNQAAIFRTALAEQWQASTTEPVQPTKKHLTVEDILQTIEQSITANPETVKLLKELLRVFGVREYIQFFSPDANLSIEGNTAYFSLPNEFVRSSMEREHWRTVKDTNGKIYRIGVQDIIFKLFPQVKKAYPYAKKTIQE